MQAHHQFAALGGGNHGGNDFFQRHDGTVHDLAARFRVLQQFRIDQGTGINDEVCLFQQFLAAYGNQISRAGAGADKVNHQSSNSFSLTRITEK